MQKALLFILQGFSISLKPSIYFACSTGESEHIRYGISLLFCLDYDNERDTEVTEEVMKNFAPGLSLLKHVGWCYSEIKYEVPSSKDVPHNQETKFEFC